MTHLSDRGDQPSGEITMNNCKQVVRDTAIKWVVTLSLLFLSLPELAAADAANPCTNDILHGRYVFTATGYTRNPAGGPGTAWVPKAILEVLQFNSDGTLTTPSVTAANPFGDTGSILQPGAGAPGSYSINDDCTGTIHFFDANNVTFKIFVDPQRGDTI